MACQKVCKQGRDDIVKVNLQSPIPTSFFYITIANLCENDAQGCGFVNTTIISSLLCILFGMPSLQPFTFFKSCNFDLKMLMVFN